MSCLFEEVDSLRWIEEIADCAEAFGKVSKVPACAALRCAVIMQGFGGPSVAREVFHALDVEGGAERVGEHA